MAKFQSAVCALSLFVAFSAGASQATRNEGTHSLQGVMKYEGESYTVQVALDEIEYGNGRGHKAYIKPEEYKVQVVPGLPYGKVSCPGIDGAGLKGFSGNDVNNAITCEWKSQNGRDAEFIMIPLTLKSGRITDVTPLFREIKHNGKNLRGRLVHRDEEGMLIAEGPLSLTMDEIDYRNGNGHKAFIQAERAGHKIDTSLLPQGYRITSCEYGLHTHQVNGIYGRTPKAVCSWKRGNGSSAPVGQVVLN